MDKITILYLQSILNFLITKEAHELGIICDENYKEFIETLYAKIREINQ